MTNIEADRFQAVLTVESQLHTCTLCQHSDWKNWELCKLTFPYAMRIWRNDVSEHYCFATFLLDLFNNAQ